MIKIKIFDNNSCLVGMFFSKIKRLKKFNFIVNKSVKRDSLDICVNIFQLKNRKNSAWNWLKKIKNNIVRVFQDISWIYNLKHTIYLNYSFQI